MLFCIASGRAIGRCATGLFPSDNDEDSDKAPADGRKSTADTNGEGEEAPKGKKLRRRRPRQHFGVCVAWGSGVGEAAGVVAGAGVWGDGSVDRHRCSGGSVCTGPVGGGGGKGCA